MSVSVIGKGVAANDEFIKNLSVKTIHMILLNKLLLMEMDQTSV